MKIHLLTVKPHVREICALQGCYAVRGGKYSPTFRGQPYHETSVRIYHYALRNNPEEGRSHPHHGGNLKTNKYLSYVNSAVVCALYCVSLKYCRKDTKVET